MNILRKERTQSFETKQKKKHSRIEKGETHHRPIIAESIHLNILRYCIYDMHAFLQK